MRPAFVCVGLWRATRKTTPCPRVAPQIGYQCPVLLDNGRPCTGKITGTHFKQPRNQKRKQKRVEDAAAAAAAVAAAARAAKAQPKPSAPAKPKVATAAGLAAAAVMRPAGGVTSYATGR